jgi:hypothetical protein
MSGVTIGEAFAGRSQAAAAKAGTKLSFAFEASARVYVVRELNGCTSIVVAAQSKPFDPVVKT